MKKATLAISFDKDKLDAISYFLAKKDLNLQAELERTLENLWQKHIPAPVQEYLTQTAEQNEDSSK